MFLPMLKWLKHFFLGGTSWAPVHWFLGRLLLGLSNSTVNTVCVVLKGMCGLVLLEVFLRRSINLSLARMSHIIEFNKRKRNLSGDIKAVLEESVDKSRIKNVKCAGSSHRFYLLLGIHSTFPPSSSQPSEKTLFTKQKKSRWLYYMRYNWNI